MKASKYTSIKDQNQKTINDFTIYLQTLRYAKDTIRADTNYASDFLAWLEKTQTKVNEVTYNDLLCFIEYSCSVGDSIILVNRKLSAIRKYYDCLLHKEEVQKNPATGVFIKNRHHTIPSNLLSSEELTDIYDSYQVTDQRSQRNKVIIGLLVFQGLTREELGKLEVTHIKLSSGKIEVPCGRHSNARILNLESVQMLEMSEYLLKIRPEILKAKGQYGTGRKPQTINKEKVQNQLFISMHGSENIKNSFLHLFYALRKLNPKLINAKQIRQSVITQWLKTKPLRTVQYMAGHRYVSSTERYEAHSLEDLYAQLEKLHPLSAF
jgi:integrase/recombinase XerD